MDLPNLSSFNYSKRIYLVIKIIISVAFIFWIAYVAYHLILPSKKININLKNPNKTSSLVTINEKSSVLDFFVVLPENFSRVTISVSILPDENKNTLPDFQIYKTYTAFAYPLVGEKDKLKKEEIIQLVSNKDSVYIVRGSKKIPIDNPLTFEAHGFQWKNIIKSDKINNFNQLELAPLFHLKNPHPDGTVFQTTDTHKFYYIINQEKYLLTGDALNYPQLKEIAIPVAEKSLTTFVTCQPHKKWLSANFVCRSNLERINNFPGSFYRFENKKIKQSSVNNIRINLSYTATLYNIRRSISITFRRILNRFHIISLR